MKQFILLFAIAIFSSLSVKAQDITLMKSSMVMLVAEAKASYVRGSTFESFSQKLVGTVKPSVVEDQLLREVYGFLSTGATPETIYNSYNGDAFKAIKTSKSPSVALNPSNERCGFFCQLYIKFLFWIGVLRL